MKLSKREIIMLAILLILAVVFIEYRVIITPGIEKISALSTKLTNLEAQVKEINLNLSSANLLKDKRDKNLAEIDSLSVTFIDGLDPDVLLLYVHNVLLERQFQASNYSISEVKASALSPRAISVSQLTYKISDLAIEYQALQAAKSSTLTSEQKASNKTESSSIETFSIQVNAVGSYAQVVSLVDQIQNLNRSIALANLNLYYMNDNALKIDMTIQFYGIKKINPTTDEFTEWKRPAYDGGQSDPYKNTIPVPQA